MFRRLKQHDAYRALPRKVSNSILIQLHKNWPSFFEAMEVYRADPSRFTGRPRIPGYKDKEKGRGKVHAYIEMNKARLSGVAFGVASEHFETAERQQLLAWRKS